MKIHSSSPDSIREFDAHIYYRLEDRASAEALRKRLLKSFSNQEVRVGRLIDRPVGPHPLPMFELNFKKEIAPKVQHWLEANRDAHTVLIHEVTGDDPRDHTVGARWLGVLVALDFSRLDPSPGPALPF